MYNEPQIVLAGELKSLQKLSLKLASEGVGRNIGQIGGKAAISIYGAGPYQLKRLLDYALGLGISEVIKLDQDKEDQRKNGQDKRVRNRRKVAA